MLTNVGENIITSIINELYNKYTGVNKADIRKIVLSQFKVLKKELNSGGAREVKMIHLGSFVPTKRHLNNIKLRKEKDEQSNRNI